MRDFFSLKSNLLKSLNKAKHHSSYKYLLFKLKKGGTFFVSKKSTTFVLSNKLKL